MTTRNELLLAPVPIDDVGSQREGLYSMFRRTCERNQLLVNDVVFGLVLPLAGPKENRLRKLVKPLYLMNRGGLLAERFVSKVEELCAPQNWYEATLKELAELKGIAGLAVAQHRRWCAHCYDEDCHRTHGPYDRLLWSVELVSACPVHQVKLEDSCLSCGAGKLPVLMGSDISGFCPRCRGYLGGLRKTLTSSTDDYARYLLWTSRAFADLLDDPLPVDHDAGAPFLSMLRSISEFHFGGAYSRLASAISRNKSVVGTWFAAGAAPGWKAACEVSFVFKIPLRDLLIGDEAAVKFSTVGALPLSATERYLRPRRLPKARDLSFFRMFLKEVADGAHPALASMNAVAEKLAIDASALRRLLPEESGALTAILAARRAEIRLRTQSRRAVELEAAIRQVGDDLARNAGPLTRRNVDLKLRHLGFQLRHEDSVPVRKRVAAAKEEAERILSGNL